MNEYDELLSGGQQGNEYDAMLLGEEKQRRQMLRGSVLRALPSNPDQYAKARQLASKTGLHPDIVERNLPEVERSVKLNEYDELLRTSPQLAEHLRDPDFAKLSHDDTHTLSLIEQIQGTARAPFALVQRLGGSFGKAASSVNTLLGALPTVYDKAASVLTGKTSTEASDWWFRTMVEPLVNRQDAFELPRDATLPEKVAGATGDMLGMLSQIVLTGGLGQAPAASATVSQTIAHAFETASKSMAFPALSEAVDVGRKVYAETGNSGQAIKAAEMAYATTTAMGVVPLSAPGGLTARIATGAAAGAATGEAGREAMNTALPDTMQSPFDFEQLLVAAVTGGALGGVMGPRPEPAINESIRRAYNDTSRADQAEQNLNALRAIGQAAQASKLRGRDATAFQQYVRNITGDSEISTLYVDAKTLGQVLNQNKIAPEVFFAKMPEVVAQLTEATLTRGDVRIPLADYAAHIAGGPVDEALLSHLKTSPEGMTYQQSRDYYQTQQTAMAEQAQRIVEERAQDDSYQGDVQTLEENLFNQMKATGRFTDDVSRASVVPLKSYFTTRAEQLGMSPSELYAKFPVKIASEQLVPGYDQAARGAFSPDTNTIALLKNADLSTFLHETGHFFLEADAQIAAMPDAPQAVRNDFNTVMHWLGVKDAAVWNVMTLEQRREHHEQFARGFEAYLLEGKAPSVELQGVFARFRAWLLNVYRNFVNLRVELSPEIRRVFDRMLASEEAIRHAEQMRGYIDLPFTPGQLAAAQVKAEEYRALGREATQAAVDDMQRRSLRDMQWLANAKSKALRRIQREAESVRQTIKDEVTKEVMDEPVEQARAFLKTGALNRRPTNQKVRRAVEQAAGMNTKLDLGALREMYGDAPAAPWRYLSTGTHGLATVKDGLHPDLVADMFGFSSGDHLVRALLDSENTASKIEGITDRRMLERHGELVDAQSIERAAEAAIHNEARARHIATGLKVLMKSPIPVRQLAKAAQQAAHAAIAAKRVRDLRPTEYLGAEARANKAALKAVGKDPRAAVEEQRAALLNNRLAKETDLALTDVRKGIDYLNKFDGEGPRASIDPEYMDQIDALRERYDLRKSTTLKSIEKRKSLAAWVESQREVGIEPEIPPELLEGLDRRSYKEMTVEEFRGLVDTVKQIEHLGRLKNKLLTAKDERDFAATVDALTSSINQHAKGKTADNRTRTTAADRAARLFSGYLASHRKVASLARELDGFKDGGPVWETLIRSMNAAGDKEAAMRSAGTKQLAKLIKPLLKGGRMGGKGRFYPSVGKSFNREERIGIALNWGNEGNRQRLLDGEGWTADQVKPVLNSLTKADWDFVRATWAFFESYRPEIAAKERRVYGKEPEWVEPSPFTVTTSDGQALTIEGGYYPIKYDARRSAEAARHADAELAKQQMRGAYVSATTRRSFTKTRADEVKGRPLLYSMDGLYSGVNEIIHDLSWHEWLIDANRLLRNKSLDASIRNHYGADVVAQFKTAVQDIAAGEMPAGDALEKTLGNLRSGAVTAAMGFNVVNSVINVTGFTQGVVRVGPRWVAQGIGEWARSPVGLVQRIHEKSTFMKLRAQTLNREINEIQNRVRGKSAARAVFDRAMFLPLEMTQLAVDTPTWWGAYQKALAEGNVEDRAVALADQAVIDSQSSGQVKDLAAIQRGGPLKKLLTTFYGFFSSTYNLSVERTKATNFSDPLQMLKLGGDYLLIYSVPAVLGTLLKAALTGDEDVFDDPEELAKRLANDQMSYMMGTMIGMREATAAAQKAAGIEQYQMSYGGPAGLRFFQELDKLGAQVGQGEVDRALVRSAINVGGIALHLPSTQVNRTIDGIAALAEGKTENPLAVVGGAPPR